MKVLLDTNVYLAAVQSSEGREQFRTSFLPLLSVTFLSTVVAYELSVNAAGRQTRIIVDEFVRPMENADRVVTPLRRDWLRAAEVMTAIHDKEPHMRSKLPSLLNDVLIALSARQIGATLFTYNRADFQLIKRRGADFSLRVLD